MWSWISRRAQADRFPDHGGADRRLAIGALSRVPDEGAVLRAVRLRLQPDDRLCRAAVVRPRRVLRHGQLHHRLDREDLGHVGRGRDPARRRDRRHPGPGARLPRDPPAGHLLRHDHPGAGADGLLLLPAGAVHRRRGRHPAGAARRAVRLHLDCSPTWRSIGWSPSCSWSASC